MDSDCHKKGKLSPPINYLTIGDELEMKVNVKEKDLATSLKTGKVPFLSTAAMIVYLEQCCVALIDPKLPVGHDSVSVDMCVKHLHTAKKNEEIKLKKQYLYIQKGDVQNAAKEIEDLIELQPNNVQYYLLLAEIYNTFPEEGNSSISKNKCFFSSTLTL